MNEVKNDASLILGYDEYNIAHIKNKTDETDCQESILKVVINVFDMDQILR